MSMCARSLIITASSILLTWLARSPSRIRACHSHYTMFVAIRLPKPSSTLASAKCGMRSTLMHKGGPIGLPSRRGIGRRPKFGRRSGSPRVALGWRSSLIGWGSGGDRIEIGGPSGEGAAASGIEIESRHLGGRGSTLLQLLHETCDRFGIIRPTRVDLQNLAHDLVLSFESSDFILRE